MRLGLIAAAILALSGLVGYGMRLQARVAALDADNAALRLSVAGCEARVGFLIEGNEIENAIEDADPADLALRASEWLLANPGTD